jgi:hypothetical protein
VVIRYGRNQRAGRSAKNAAEIAQSLVALGLQPDSRLLVDAIERAYNASVCRPEFPTFAAASPE